MSKEQQPVIELNKKKEDALSKSKIEVIKNLIFGENMQAYDSEFERISKDILSKKKALEKLIEETRTELNASLDSVSTDVNIRITELEEKLENRIDDIQSDVVSSESLGKLLIDLGKKVQKK